MDEALDEVNQTRHEPLDAVAMEKYVADLQSLLRNASFMECKTFRASFVRKVEFDKRQVRIEYTAPVALENGIADTTEVRNIGKAGTALSPASATPSVCKKQAYIVPREGFEPTPPCGERILSPPRLPFRHLGL